MKNEKSEKNKKAEGRISKIKPDIYERIKKDARYRKMSVDQYLDALLRRELFHEKKKTHGGKKDFLGYCPNCSSKVKVSTLKSEGPAIQEVAGPGGQSDTERGLFSRLFGKKQH